MNFANGSRNFIAPLKNLFSIELENSIIWLPIFFATGILLYFSFDEEPSTLITFLISLSLALISFIYRKAYFATIILLLSFMAAGIFTANLRSKLVENPHITKNYHYTNLTARITSISPLTHGYRLILDQIQTNTIEPRSLPKKIRLTVKTDLNGSQVNDVIRIKANLMPPPKPIIQGGYNFARTAYFDQIGAIGYSLSPIKILTSKKNSIFEKISQIRQHMTEDIFSILGIRKGSIAAALMIGEYNAINRDDLNNMRIAGISHILSVSGMHMSLVAAICFIFIRIILALCYPIIYNQNNKKISAIIALCGSLAYLLISGMQVAAVRSFIMSAMIIIAVILDRIASPMRSIMWAAFLILLFTPENIINPSFQMSFAAVMALVACYEFYQQYLSAKFIRFDWLQKIWLYFVSTIFSSLVAGLATAPFVLYHFNQYSNYSIIANLIAVPITSFILMPCVILAFILYPVGLIKLALIPMGIGIEWVINSSNFIAGLGHSVKYFHYLPLSAILLLSSGIIILCLAKTKLRFLGPFIAVAGMIVAIVAPLPLIVIDQKNHLLIAHQDEALIFITDTLSNYQKETWLKHFGARNYKLLPQGEAENISCDAMLNCHGKIGEFDFSWEHGFKLLKNNDIVLDLPYNTLKKHQSLMIYKIRDRISYKGIKAKKTRPWD